MEKSAFFAIVHSPPISLLYNGQFAVRLFFALSGDVLALPWHQRGRTTQDRGSLASSLSRDGRQHAKETEADAASLRLRRRLWERFLRLHIPAAASVLLSYCLQSMGAFRHDITTLPPEQLPWWESTLPPPNSTSFIDVLPALSGGEILFGKTALNVVLWTLKLEFWGSIDVLLYGGTLTLFFFALDVLYVLRSIKNRKKEWVPEGLSCRVLVFHKIEAVLSGRTSSSCKLKRAVFPFFPFKRITWHSRIAYKKHLQSFSVVQFFSTTKPLHNKAAATFFSSPFALFLGRVSFPVYYASACPRLTWG